MPTFTNWNDEIKFEVSHDHFKIPKNISDVKAIIKQASL
jgi:hypothetical protein